MERHPPPPPLPEAEPPPGADPLYEETRPATVAELRNVRRWLVVAGVWAVAASAIAIIALLDNQDEEPKGPRGVSAAQLTRVQKDLDKRVDGVESKLEDLPQSDDVSKLEGRLKKVEDARSGTADDIQGLNRDLDRLEQRVEEAERQQQNGSGSGDGTTTTP